MVVSWCGGCPVHSSDGFRSEDRIQAWILGWPDNPKDVRVVRRHTLDPVGPDDIQVGDLLEIGPWGRWALHSKNDYSRHSAEWLLDGGLFLVIDKYLADEEDNPLIRHVDGWHFELYEAKTNSWSTFWINVDGSDRSATIMKHIPADKP